MCSAACRRTAWSAAEQPSRGLPALPTMVAYERPRRDIGFHFVDQVAREAKSVGRASRRSPPTPTPCAPPSTRNCSGRWRRRCRRGSRATSATPAASSSAAPRRTSPQAVQRDRSAARKPATSGRPGSRRSRMRGCRSTTCTGRRPWWWRKPGGKKGEAWRVGLADGRILPLSIDNAAAQRKLALHDVVFVRVTEGKGKSRGARGAARASGGAGHGGRAGEQDRPHPRHDRRLLLSAEPAQPRDPGGAPAGLRHQAAELSGGARQGPAAQYAGARRADHAAADRRRPRPRAGLLDAEELRRRRRRDADLAPRAGEFAQSGDRASARRRHREDARKRASTGCARSRWKRRSTANACATIRSCSAPSRCGRSISRPSMRRSPTKACARSRTSSNRSSATASSSIATIRNRRSRSARSTAPPSISSRPCCRACWRAAPRARSPGLRPTSPARPAPPTTRTTPGSSASPTTSRSRSGSATTTPTASAARSAAARPAAASRCRSSSR